MLQTCATKAETEKNYKAAFDFYKQALNQLEILQQNESRQNMLQIYRNKLMEVIQKAEKVKKLSDKQEPVISKPPQISYQPQILQPSSIQPRPNTSPLTS